MIERKQACAHFTDEEMKRQSSSCFAHETVVNSGAGTSPLALLAPVLRCFSLHTTGGQKKTKQKTKQRTDLTQKKTARTQMATVTVTAP